jgi:hypothetical protein
MSRAERRSPTSTVPSSAPSADPDCLTPELELILLPLARLLVLMAAAASATNDVITPEMPQPRGGNPGPQQKPN